MKNKKNINKSKKIIFKKNKYTKKIINSIGAAYNTSNIFVLIISFLQYIKNSNNKNIFYHY